MKKLKTPKEVFLYLSKIYKKCKSIDDCYGNGIDEYICVSIDKLYYSQSIITRGLHEETRSLLYLNKPSNGHWCTLSPYWMGYGSWWIVCSNQVGLPQVFQDKSRFLKELSDSL